MRGAKLGYTTKGNNEEENTGHGYVVFKGKIHGQLGNRVEVMRGVGEALHCLPLPCLKQASGHNLKTTFTNFPLPRIFDSWVLLSLPVNN
jgi:hypothetical protein